MASVYSRAREVKQPYGGYLQSSQYEIIQMKDGLSLNADENIHGSYIGLAVDYLTRYMLGINKEDAFKVSINGAGAISEKALKRAFALLHGIQGLDDKSIYNACKLVTFDVSCRNPSRAHLAIEAYNNVKPDLHTLANIRIMVERSLLFFKKYGPIVSAGFTFKPVEINTDAKMEMIISQKGTYGGYTATVSSGDGDFLTKDTLWDFKVTRDKPSSRDRLQVLMYWIMGKHSGQEIYKNINKIGIYNPRHNLVYLLDMETVSPEIIEIVEREVICYED